MSTLIDANQWNGKDVVVPEDVTIILDASVSPKSVTVYGRLVRPDDRDLAIATRSIFASVRLFELIA
jgi:hypothetical protein